jgi:iron(III) transport system substrate-binding protein
VPTGVTIMGILAYNKTKVANPPSTWQALASSVWKGQVGMNDPSQSGPTFPRADPAGGAAASFAA